MRLLPLPNLEISEIYLACIKDTKDPKQASKYEDAHEDICANANLYRKRAAAHNLFEFSPCEWGKDDQVLLKELTKGDLNALYKKGLVSSSTEGRQYYDKILTSAPLGKCPYCQFGHISTLDHFLPKARYPSLSVVPDNLVPSCMDCNSGKGSQPITKESEISHPYFEDSRIESETWLRAEITMTNPLTARFTVACPAHWPPELTRRVSNYFMDFDLSKRYSIEAASELVSISAHLTYLTSPTLRMEHLGRNAKVERDLSRNSWKAALYQALAESDWYGNVGFAGTGTP